MEITFNLTVDDKGIINRDESMLNFENMLTNMCAEQKKEQETIANAVSAVFDTLNGKRAPLDFVIGQATNKIGAVSENYTSLYDKVDHYLHVNSKGDNSLFNIGRGKGHAGIGRVKDLTA
jgi:hypothetical protein